MKAFVIAALLVASVAAQNLDLLDLMKEKSLLKTRPFHTRSTVQDLLLKEKLGGKFGMDYDYPSMTNGVYDDVTSTMFGDVDQVIPIEELVNIPLFREYMRIPLFRQFWVQYPVVFRRYVESPLFQKFWTFPEFKMYFRNPVFFYKYIVPQIQLISEIVPTQSEGIYNYNYDTVSNTPYGYNKEWSVPMSMGMNNMNMNKNNYGIMGKTFPFGRTSTSTINSPMHYKYLLEKMMEQLRFNKINRHGVSETFTDVKELPTGDIVEHTVGEMIDPFTGEKRITPGDIKYVTEKMIPYTTSMDSVYGIKNINIDSIHGLPTPTLKDALIKHILLSKIFGQKVMTPKVYSTLMGKDLTSTLFPHFINKGIWTPELLSTIFSSKVLSHPELTDSLFSTHKTLSPELFETVFGEHKKFLTPEIYELLVKGKRETLSPRVLEKVFGNKIYNPEILRTLFDVNVNVPEEIYGLKNKNIDIEDKMVFNPLVSRMLRNKVMVPETLQTLEMIKKEKMIEEFEKERMVQDLIKNKDLYTMESVLPKMMETETFQKVPLTFGKPFFGSQIDESMFHKEKDIKF